MKNILLSGIAFVMFSCGTQSDKQDDKNTEKKPVPKTTIEFVETNHDFGKIVQGEKISYYFTYKNTGNNPLIVSQVQPACGCTVPDWTREPVAPGKEGRVEVLFNSEGRDGMQHKYVTVVSNTTPSTNELTFTAEIVKSK